MSDTDEVQAAVDRVLGEGAFTLDDLATMRAGLDAYAAAVSVREPVHEVRDELLALPDRSVPLRWYGTEEQTDAVLVWMHGGGYVSGTLDAIDPVCRSLVNRLGDVRIVSVGYRLAPEHPYPAGLDDCLAAVEDVAARPEVRRVAVGGDSAGGGLAAAVARRTSVPLRAHVLLCPWLDASLASPSVREKGTDFQLTEASLRAMARLYGGDPRDPGVSPLLGDLAELPPAVVVTAEHDPLRDEGEAYAAGIVAAGGRAWVRRWDGVLHGFPGMTAELPEAGASLQWVADRLRELLSGS